MVSRRRFLSHAAGAVTVAGVGGLALGAGAEQKADPMTVALIGCGGMGRSNMRSFLQLKGTEIAAVCDVDDTGAPEVPVISSASTASATAPAPRKSRPLNIA